MWFEVDVNGINIKLQIYGYKQTNKDNCFDEWCKCDFKFTSGAWLNYHKENDEKTIRDYLTVNEILTQENLDQLNSVRFSSGENGIDGSAGKRKRYVYKVLEGDRVEFVWYNGEFRKLNSEQVRYYYDREYFERFKLYLNQFK